MLSLGHDAIQSQLKDLVLRQINSTVIAGYSRFFYLISAMFLKKSNCMVKGGGPIIQQNSEKLNHVIPLLLEASLTELNSSTRTLIRGVLEDIACSCAQDSSRPSIDTIVKYFSQVRLTSNIEADIRSAVRKLIDSVVEQQRHIIHFLIQGSLSSASAADPSATGDNTDELVVEDEVVTSVGMITSQYDLRIDEWKREAMRCCMTQLKDFGTAVPNILRGLADVLDQCISKAPEGSEQIVIDSAGWESFTKQLIKRINAHLYGNRRSIKKAIENWLLTKLKKELIKEVSESIELLAKI